MRHTFITGATGGIGRAVAKERAGANTHLYLHYYRNKSAALDIQEECRKLGSKVTLVQADFGLPTGANDCFKQLDARIDDIIFASGTAFYGLLDDHSDEEVDRLMNEHLASPIRLIKRILPQMIEQKAGRIVLVASIWGEVGASFETVYSAAKGGQIAFVKALAKEVAPSHITVNAVSPGVIQTAQMEGFSLEELRQLSQEIPAGRFGYVHEVAHACNYLLSEEAAYVNGHVLSINGAWSG
ncbi:elongation factor P 5-aminopentanone reductase [Geomicrobium sp. JCM 19039]|uniref:elongation factor P 5-aminopentanone reductase n=1 Tax=Geomicrobium sp. JCM 19039 TaxID=1460636 RepID=UPI00045F2773|nr:SDR family oxidoreductase [Geomicrobium sp. JCM 19039]GAK10980.1 3-oxoacyl-[acyl-carrier protein] reductase [Geomicrobium sp. JCM 19039]